MFKNLKQPRLTNFYPKTFEIEVNVYIIIADILMGVLLQIQLRQIADFKTNHEEPLVAIATDG